MPRLTGRGGGLGKKWSSSLTCQGTLREWEVGTPAFLVPPPRPHPGLEPLVSFGPGSLPSLGP